ncbi:MAG: hypothetical protein AAGI15_16095 [Pseudomonadota bacterium]
MSKPLDPALTISASPEDAADPRRSGGSGGGGGRRSRTSGGGGSVAVSLILVILLAGLMVAGWFVANQQQMLTAAQSQRAEAEARLATLEDRLRVTDEVMSEAGADTKSELGRWESEIRKLWAVSNERNKGWIQGNQAALKKQDGVLAKISGQQQSLANQLTELETALKAQGALREELGALTKRMDELVGTQRDLVDKVNAARQTVASLQSGLANRVTENEQAVASMDAYRLQLNNRLAELERRLAGG